MDSFQYKIRRTVALSQMGSRGEVPQDFCREICSEITIWLRQNREVRARNDAKRVRQGPYGWELPLGENRFGVEMAVKWSREYLKTQFKKETMRSFLLTLEEKQQIEFFAACAVIGHENRLFRDKYKVDDGKIWFGTHAVVLSRFAHAVGKLSGFNEDGASNKGTDRS